MPDDEFAVLRRLRASGVVERTGQRMGKALSRGKRSVITQSDAAAGPLRTFAESKLRIWQTNRNTVPLTIFADQSPDGRAAFRLLVGKDAQPAHPILARPSSISHLCHG